MTILGPKMVFLGPFNSIQRYTIKYKGKMDDTLFPGSIFQCLSDENIFDFSKNFFRSQKDHFRAKIELRDEIFLNCFKSILGLKKTNMGLK